MKKVLAAVMGLLPAAYLLCLGLSFLLDSQDEPLLVMMLGYCAAALRSISPILPALPGAPAVFRRCPIYGSAVSILHSFWPRSSSGWCSCGEYASPRQRALWGAAWAFYC